MKVDFHKLTEQAFKQAPKETSWEWAERAVDYSKAGNYDTPYKGQFDADLMPFWKEPLEAMQDPAVREIAVIKSARAGYSENLLLTDLRYVVANSPEPTMYVTGTMDVAKGFHERRVCRGMSLTAATAKEFRRAKATGTEIQFPGMDFRSTWASSDSASKSDGWARIYCDEVSLWSEFGVDMVRRRAAAYPFHHICYGGSIDPTKKGDPYEDPIVKLYEESDKRVWKMSDGKGLFQWELSGIKWSQDAKDGAEWDLQQVEATAYYETPNGVRIEEQDRMKYTRSGQWVATAQGIRRGYKVVAPMIPFADCTFGQLAKRFLSAKSRGIDLDKKGKTADTLRVYFAENWAEPHYESKKVTTAEELTERVGEYQYGTSPAQIEIYKEIPSSIYATADVQKDHLWLAIRCWLACNGGDSGLILYQRCEDWPELFEICKANGVERVYCDAAYANRQQEVYEVAAKTPGFVPVIDNANLKGAYKRETIDPFEGTRRQGSAGLITRYTVNPNIFRHKLMELMRGETDQIWMIPRGTPMEYQTQVTAEQYIAGEWKRIRRDNHAFDVEVLQAFAAARHGILKFYHGEEKE